MRDHGLKHRSFEWLCACLILAPCAALAQQAGATPQAAAASADAAAPSTPPSPAAQSKGAAPAKQADDIEPAVDTSAQGASRPSDARANGAAEVAQPDSRARTEPDAKKGPGARPSGKSMDHLDLGTTDITGNRELPKVMYIVPWKRSDLGDLTGKPLNSLVDQTLEPVDRNVFERSNRYYGAVTNGASTSGAPAAGAAPPAGATGASQDAHRTPGSGSGPAARDER